MATDFERLSFRNLPVRPRVLSPTRPEDWLCSEGCRMPWREAGHNWLRDQCLHEAEAALRETERIEAQRQARREAREASDAAQLRLDSRISQILAGCTFANFRVEHRAMRAIMADVRLMSEHPQGALYLDGPTGTGKSHLAAAACNAVLDRGQRAVMRYSHELFAELFEEVRRQEDRDSASRSLLESLHRSRLLVLDDYALVRPKALEADHLLEILHHRMAHGGGLIITSNVPMTALKGRYVEAGAALFSRLSGLCRREDGEPRIYTVPASITDHRIRPLAAKEARHA
ncbi:MAG TPA: AFG1/ZapE family ATPase [Armatimonadota bacterium]|jgi:DNA replication protein DnaC